MDARFETAINDLCGVYSRFTETVTSILLKLPVRSKDTGKYATLREFTSYLLGPMQEYRVVILLYSNRRQHVLYSILPYTLSGVAALYSIPRTLAKVAAALYSILPCSWGRIGDSYSILRTP